MGEYFASCFGVAAVVSACSLLLYKKSGAARLALSVLLIYSVLVPLSAVFSGFGGLMLDGELGDISGYDKEYENVAREAFCEGIDAYVCSELGLNSSGVLVDCEGFNYREMRAERVTVTLSGRCISADSLKIKRLIEDGGLGMCEVEIEIG